MNEEPQQLPPINRTALLSLIAGLLTAISFCIAVAPIPLTGYVCYPAAAVLGAVALVTGIAALGQIRASGEDGRPFALIGIWIGSIAILAALVAITLGILLFPKVLALLHQYIK